MIAWSMTVHYSTDATDFVADVAENRTAAVAAAADALRKAVLDAGRTNRCDAPAPRFVVTMDREDVASIQLTRTELGKLTVDDALNCIEQFEATETVSRGSSSEAAFGRRHPRGVAL